MRKKTFQDLLDDDERSVADIAEEAGTHMATLYRLARGDRGRYAGIVTARRIAGALGVTVIAVFDAILETLRQKERNQ